MQELSIGNEVVNLSLANGAKIYSSCSSGLVVKLVAHDLHFVVQSLVRGNHVFDLPPGDYIFDRSGNTGCGCRIIVEESQPTDSVARDFELVCLKLNSDPLEAPIKAWAMPVYSQLSDTVSVTLLSFDGITPLNIADYTVVECC